MAYMIYLQIYYFFIYIYNNLNGWNIFPYYLMLNIKQNATKYLLFPKQKMTNIMLRRQFTFKNGHVRFTTLYHRTLSKDRKVHYQQHSNVSGMLSGLFAPAGFLGVRGDTLHQWAAHETGEDKLRFFVHSFSLIPRRRRLIFLLIQGGFSCGQSDKE